MKVPLYAENMNLHRKDEKYVEIQIFDFLGNKTGKKKFLSNFLSLCVI